MNKTLWDRLGNKLVLIGLFLGAVPLAYASPASFVYQGRIMGSNGAPLEYSAVAFEFTILSPNGVCALYKEQIGGIDMRNSRGVFETTIGAGTKSYPAAPSFSLLDAFNNMNGALSCSGGGTYTPLATDGRVLRVQFWDGVGWKLISPDSVIRSVPYAGFASSAMRLGNKTADDFVNRPTTCIAGDVISFDGTNFDCAAGGGGGGTGTVTSVATGAGLTGGPITTAGTIAVNVGTGANQIPQLDGAGKLNTSVLPTSVVNTSTTLGGDLSGNLPNPTVTRIQGSPVSATAPTTNGQVLIWDTNTWKADFVRMQDIRNAWGGTQMIPSTACAVHEAMVWSVITDRFTCQSVAINASAITAGTINSARLGSGTADNTTYLRGDGTWQTISTSDATKLPLAGGTMTGNIAMGGNKITGIGNVPFTAANPTVAEDGKTLKWNNTSGQWEWFTAGVAGAGITTINGASGSAQTFAPTASATSYGFTTATNTHTFSIPSASGAGVTAGTISKTEYDTFNAKQAAGNYITTLTGDVTSSSFSAGSVTATIANNAVTTAKVADGNITGAKLENSGVTAGTYTKVTVDAKGRVTVGDTLVAADIPSLDAAKITTGVLAPARLGSGTADNTKFLRGDGSWQSFVIVESDPKVGSNTADYLSKWNGSALVTSAVYENSGNVGIGTNSPGAKLEIAGQVKIAGGSPGANKVLTSDATGLATWETPSAGSVTSIIAGTGLTGGTITTSGTIAVNVGTGANQIPQLDGSGKLNTSVLPTSVITTGTTLGGDLSGTLPNPTVARIQGSPVSATAPTTNGQVLIWDTNTWKADFVRMQDIRNAWGGTQMIPSTACAANESMVWSVITDRFTCQTIGSINASAVTAGTFNTARLGTGTANATTYLRGDGTWQTVTPTESDPQVGANTTNYLSKWDGSALVASGVIENSGNVGIGTSTPATLLQVSGSGSSAAMSLINTSNTSGIGASLYIENYGSSAQPTIQMNAHRGTSASPTAIQAGDWIGHLQFQGYGASAYSGRASVVATAEQNYTNANGGTNLSFTTTALNASTETERVRISADGNVGIGTTSPTTLLSMSGSAAQTFGMERHPTANTKGNNLTIRAGGASIGATDKAGGDLILSTGTSTGDASWESPAIQFNVAYPAGASGTADRDPVQLMKLSFLLENKPLVQIGSAIPQAAPFYVAFDSDATYSATGTAATLGTNEIPGLKAANDQWADNTFAFLELKASNANGNQHNAYIAAVSNTGAASYTPTLIFGAQTGSATRAERMRIDASGNVGIGTTGPGDKLHVAGDIRAGTGTTGCVKDADGTVIAGTCSSDVRFKTDIVSMGSRLEQVSRLRPVTYKWRADEFPDKHFGHETETGLIAQEVQQAIPELVAEDEEGYLKIRFSELNIYILQAVKELYNRILGIESHQRIQDRQIASKADNKEIDVLKAENARLKARANKIEQENVEMKARLDRIEKMLK